MPSLFLDQNEARRAEKFFWRPSPSSLSQSLDDRMPPLSEGLDPPLSQYPFSRGGQGQAVEVITDEIENFAWALIHLLMARDDDEKTALSWNMFNEVFMENRPPKIPYCDLLPASSPLGFSHKPGYVSRLNTRSDERLYDNLQLDRENLLRSRQFRKGL